MFDILVEIAISIAICSIAAYFFFLSAPVEERGVGENNNNNNNNNNRYIGNINTNVFNSRGNSSSLLLIEKSRKCELAMWCNILGRWGALLFLGGGSIDKDIWTDRIAYFIEKYAKLVNIKLKQKQEEKKNNNNNNNNNDINNNINRNDGERTLRATPDIVRLLRLELSGGGRLNNITGQQQQIQIQQQSFVGNSQVSLGGNLYHTRTGSDVSRTINVFNETIESNGSVVGNSTSAGVVLGAGGNSNNININNNISTLVGVNLPRVGPGGIISVEIPYNETCGEVISTTNNTNTNNTKLLSKINIETPLRCFAVPIIYEDQRFALQLACHFPLLFALPTKLQIPADVLTLHCVLQVRRVIFHCNLYAAFKGNVIELSFAREPQFTAMFDITPVKKYYPRQYQYNNNNNNNNNNQRSTNINSSSSSIRTNFNSEMIAPLPPLAPATNNINNNNNNNIGNVLTVAQRSREKLQEIVDLAVKRAIQSITYPCVIRGRVNLPRRAASNINKNNLNNLGNISENNFHNDNNDNNNNNGLFTWTLDKATLPLCC